MKILIINSDAANNRGDRAILAGNISLLKSTWPQAEIWAISEYADRDIGWFGINFLPFSAYSLNPWHLLRLVWLARRCDYVFWGGGELLKDYTNVLGIFYWTLKINLVRLVNKQLFGLFQGIGPTHSSISKQLIAFTVNRCRSFLVRDQVSREKLLSWGVTIPLISSFDPAILCPASIMDKTLKSQLHRQLKVDDLFLKNCAGIGPRNWFHYRRGGWLPFKFRRWLGLEKDTNLAQTEQLYKALAGLCDWLCEQENLNMLFFPMHMAKSEDDSAAATKIIGYMRHSNRTRIVEQDILSPQDYLGLMAQCRLFIGVRLHSAILATVASVPSVVFYYVDKGRLYFKQLGMSSYSYPIEELLDNKYRKIHRQSVETLIRDRTIVQSQLNDRLEQMRKNIRKDFAKAIQAKT